MRPEKMEVNREPDVLQWTVIAAHRKRARVPKPPAVMDEGFPKERPLTEQSIFDNLVVVVENESVCEGFQIDEKDKKQQGRDCRVRT